ncbi:MAG: hypothetical protein ACTHNU_17820 [Gaiellales bacterium]
MTVAEAATLAVGAVATAEVVRWMPRAAGGRRLRRPKPQPGSLAPADLKACERLLRLASSSAGEAHHRLSPVLREVAAHQLASGRSIDLERDVAAARSAVSPATWELIRPDREPPGDRHARGPSMAALESVIAELERLGTR